MLERSTLTVTRERKIYVITFGHRFLQLIFDKVRYAQRSIVYMGLPSENDLNVSYTPPPTPVEMW